MPLLLLVPSLNTELSRLVDIEDLVAGDAKALPLLAERVLLVHQIFILGLNDDRLMHYWIAEIERLLDLAEPDHGLRP